MPFPSRYVDVLMASFYILIAKREASYFGEENKEKSKKKKLISKTALIKT